MNRLNDNLRLPPGALLLGLVLTSCFSPTETPFSDAGVRDAADDNPFPPALAPWESPNVAAAPAATATEMYPEEISFERLRWTGGAVSVHARAYVHADVATTFAAVRHPLAGADRREIVTFTWEEDVEPSVTWSHRSHLTIPDIVTVEFELTWLSDVIEGTVDAPTLTATRWQKTWGSSAITLLEGSIVCQPITSDITELLIQYHLNAVGSGHGTIEDYLTGYYVSILALARGDELPIQM